MIWGYMLILSRHMWSDETSPETELYSNTKYKETNDVDLEIWDQTVKFIGERKFNLALIDVGDAVKYETHPEISAPDAWDKDFMKKKLSEMRALGIEPIPKLNFSACHDTWLKEYRRKISTKEYYDLARDLIGEVCELFDSPRLFHLGFDEEDARYQSIYDLAIQRNPKLWWHDLNFMASICDKNGARPWVWSDYFWEHEEDFVKNMPKAVLQSNWYYGSIENFPKDSREYRIINTYELLDKYGYDQVPTPSTWSLKRNIKETVGFGKNRISEERLKGFLVAPWMFTDAENRYTLMDDAERMYLARELYYPETLK